LSRYPALLAVEPALGSETLSFEELEARFGSEAMKKVFSGSGIRNRQVAAAGVTGADLACAAAERLFEKHSIDRSRIDLIIHCTQSPDHWLPTTACLLQDRLRLPKCAAFDINLGCSQYVYALSVAHSMIRAGVARRALVLTGDTMTHALNPRDRALVPLMGDAGSASLVGLANEGEGFLHFELGTDGAGAKYLMIPSGGARQPRSAETAREAADAEGNVRSADNLFMNGPAIFHFAISTVPKTIKTLLEKSGTSLDQVDLVLFHQANRYMLDYLVKKLGIPPEKTHFYVENVGNTSGSTMPLVVHDALAQGKLRPGALVLLMVFGVGLSWAATLMRFPADPAGLILREPAA
jgi:3-oxoacyl-[acyl-carrier-protein] synthase-3